MFNLLNFNLLNVKSIIPMNASDIIPCLQYFSPNQYPAVAVPLEVSTLLIPIAPITFPVSFDSITNS